MSGAIPAARLEAFAAAVLVALGVPEADARGTAEAMAWADLRGLPAHGVATKLPQCVARIRAGGSNAAPNVRVLGDRGAMLALDVDNAWGQVAARRGMELAIERSRSHGLGVVSVRNSSSAAALGFFPTLAIRARRIGLAVTNGPPLMPALGGTTRLLGNQAHAIGVPAGRHPPLLFDSATTTMSTGEMDVLHEAGLPLPEGVLLTGAGEPTRDAAAWRTGLLVPSGGHRGYALSLLFEVLTGVLAGGPAFGPDVGQPFVAATPQGVSHLLVAIDPTVLLPYDEFVDRVDAFVDEIHGAPPAPGVERVWAPGERGHLGALERARAGVELTDEQRLTLTALGLEVGVEL